jgi:hypothetical protein
MVHQLAKQEGRALATFGLDKRIERVEPFARFLGIRVRRVHAPEGGADDIGEIGHS